MSSASSRWSEVQSPSTAIEKGTKLSQRAADELPDRLHAELAGRMADARGDVKCLNATMREYFDGMDLICHDDGRVEVRPVLRPAQLARFLDRGDIPMGRKTPDNNPHTPS